MSVKVYGKANVKAKAKVHALRDAFALEVITTFQHQFPSLGPKSLAEKAYALADAMLAERKRRWR